MNAMHQRTHTLQTLTYIHAHTHTRKQTHTYTHINGVGRVNNKGLVVIVKAECVPLWRKFNEGRAPASCSTQCINEHNAPMKAYAHNASMGVGRVNTRGLVVMVMAECLPLWQKFNEGCAPASCSTQCINEHNASMNTMHQ